MRNSFLTSIRSRVWLSLIAGLDTPSRVMISDCDHSHHLDVNVHLNVEVPVYMPEI